MIHLDLLHLNSFWWRWIFSNLIILMTLKIDFRLVLFDELFLWYGWRIKAFSLTSHCQRSSSPPRHAVVIALWIAVSAIRYQIPLRLVWRSREASWRWLLMGIWLQVVCRSIILYKQLIIHHQSRTCCEKDLFFMHLFIHFIYHRLHF